MVMKKKYFVELEEHYGIVVPRMAVMQPVVVNVSSENVASEGLGVSRDPDDIENVYLGERVIEAFDFDNREDGR
jgi:hypothetical protein